MFERKASFGKLLPLLLLFVLIIGFSTTSFAQRKGKTEKAFKKEARNTDEAQRAKNSAHIFREIMTARDKIIPLSVLGKADCIAVFPNVIKAAFVIGGQYGKGLVSCRVGNGWSSPAFIKMKGGSVGFQIGGQSTDFVLLFMTKDGIESLFDKKFTIGTELSVAAGPIGRKAGASTDIGVEAQILSYSKTKGAFAGVSLDGVQITADVEAIEDAYGSQKKPTDLIKQRSQLAPNSLEIYPNTLRKYKKQKIKNEK